MKRKIILCSACLLGARCRYNGESKLNKKVVKLLKKETLVPVCPEQLGGLPTPRIPQEIQGCSGKDVLNRKCRVRNKEGKDVTGNFIKGAKETLKLAQLLKVKEAILKQKSPSCGCGKIYDGTFSDRIVKGDGVTAALLKRNKIKVMTEEDL